MKTRMIAFAAFLSGAGFIIWPLVVLIARKSSPEYLLPKVLGGFLVASLALLVILLERNASRISSRN
jgi:hypothetical protein